ncbi:MAG: thioredoxin [Clostridia bacterium]|nr:thioredoxin [Clostridia bacterium]
MTEITLTKDTFQSEVIESDKPVLIDFFATWCGPCMMLSPIIKEIADEYDEKIKVCKVNVDDESELASTFGIASIPTLIVVENGKVKNMSVGYRSKEEILKMIEA